MALRLFTLVSQSSSLSDPLIHLRRDIAHAHLTLGDEALDAAVGRAGAALAQRGKSAYGDVLVLGKVILQCLQHACFAERMRYDAVAGEGQFAHRLVESLRGGEGDALVHDILAGDALVHTLSMLCAYLEGERA